MKSFARRCFVLLSFTLPAMIYAQITINGTVTDHEQNPISIPQLK